MFAKQKRELTGRWPADPEDGARLRARQTSMWKGTHRFTSGGRTIAESGSTGSWSPRPTLACDEAVPLDHQVFLLWLELLISRRNQSAATGAIVAGGAAAAGS